MRFSQNWGKNYTIDDLYSLVTTNTNKLDVGGEAEIHSGETADYPIHSMQKHCLIHSKFELQSFQGFFQQNFVNTHTEELVIHW